MIQSAPAVSILQVTDMHILAHAGEKLLGIDTEWTFHAILEQAWAENKVIDAMLVTGDLAEHPCESSYQRILKKLETYDVPSLCLPGNHDDYGLMQQILNAGTVSCSKQLNLENWQIICLNSQIPGAPGGHLSSRELEFLDDCLRKKPDSPTLIAVHHHCQKTQSVWMDTMMIDNSRQFLSVVAMHPQVKTVICGHIHQLMDTQSGSVRILGTPSTCFQFTPGCTAFSVDEAAPGYRMIDLYADGHIETRVSFLKEKITGLQINAGSY